MEGQTDTSVVLLGATSSLLAIGFVLWLAFSWTGYAERYAAANEGWHLGQTRLVEITVVPDDRYALGCASDKEPGGLHCAFHAHGAPYAPEPSARASGPTTVTLARGARCRATAAPNIPLPTIRKSTRHHPRDPDECRQIESALARQGGKSKGKEEPLLAIFNI